MVADKLKQANKKWKHEHKRRLKKFAEKNRKIISDQEENRKRNLRRKAELDYIRSLSNDE